MALVRSLSLLFTYINVEDFAAMQKKRLVLLINHVLGMKKIQSLAYFDDKSISTFFHVIECLVKSYFCDL